MRVEVLLLFKVRTKIKLKIMSSSTQLEKLIEIYGFREIQNDLQWLKDLKMKEIFINIRTYKEGIKDGSLTKKQWDEVIPLYGREVDKITYPKSNRDKWEKHNFEETIEDVDDIEHTSYFIENRWIGIETLKTIKN